MCPLLLWTHVDQTAIQQMYGHRSTSNTALQINGIFTKVVQTVLQNDLSQHLCLNSFDWKKEKFPVLDSAAGVQ